MRSKTDATLKVAVVTYDGLSLFEFSAACEVFGRHNSLVRAGFGELYRLVVCGEDQRVGTDHGFALDVPHRLAALRRADIVVLPPCVDPEAVSQSTLAAVRRAHARGARVLSLCTGAFVLARTGLLDGRRAVTHWADCDRFARAYPGVSVDPSVLYVDDGDILTSAGSAASIDLCLHVVRTDHGAQAANRLARSLVVPPHRDGGQAQYVASPMPPPPADDPFAATLTWMQEHLADAVSVEDLAQRAATSPRNFARRFSTATGTTPHQWLVGQRVRRAQELLETTDLPVETVAERSGLGNAGNLRKVFRQHVRTSPASYRATFRTSPPAEASGAVVRASSPAARVASRR